MEHAQSIAPQSDWQDCFMCGRKIRLLTDHSSLIRFLGEASTQRRAFQCKNCGQVTCFECSKDNFICACNGNAWVALPYLEMETPATEMNLQHSS